MSLQIQAQPPADPTEDVPQHEAELNAFLAKQLASGVPHGDLLASLLSNFRAMVAVYPCCTTAAGKAALQVGGQLLVAAIERPANVTTH